MPNDDFLISSSFLHLSVLSTVRKRFTFSSFMYLLILGWTDGVSIKPYYHYLDSVWLLDPFDVPTSFFEHFLNSVSQQDIPGSSYTVSVQA